MQNEDVSLRLPKFNFSSDITLRKVLTDMGMPDAFDRDLADFSGMTAEKPLYIGNIFHKAFITVDEKGTEAAAATGAAMATESSVSESREPKMMTVDHPFLFIIRDKVSGQILFIGRVLDPTEE